ncbi:hypothetical protein EJ02DRAFT_460471 [Clathrospora elynae]|uniref:Uncharacterized protein n=1 Tax=Clathrospora elynae TaxID=706981 RepID=A0A6A5S5F7_9PLEO|nr:hypothetical protein EJ02DRAFT_460471 [Clathrospora elynae]
MSSSDKPTIILKDSTTWPFWFSQLKYEANFRGIWNEINPDAKDAQPIYEQEPIIPTIRPDPGDLILPVATTPDEQTNTETLTRRHDQLILNH